MIGITLRIPTELNKNIDKNKMKNQNKISSFESRELSKNELLNISGGNPWLWTGIGYLVGEVLDGIQDGLDRASAGDGCEEASDCV